MGLSIIITKVKQTENIYYYSVCKRDSTEISYYMGLCPTENKILFFKEKKFNIPNCIYSVSSKTYEKIDLELQSIIGNYAVIKGIQALRNNNFPDDISYES